MNTVLKRISISSIPGVRIGHAGDVDAGTGCTVVLSETGMCAGVDVRGGGPASRESELLNPQAAADCIHAVLLGGGSAFGLGAGNGVMSFLQERGIGLDTGFAKVPLVCQSDLYDLCVGDSAAFPDAQMAYQACLNAFEGEEPASGNVGAGTGCTVGKLAGPARMMKSGIGFAAFQIGELKVGAVAAVNALGDIFDADAGIKLAGLLSEDQTAFESSEALMYRMQEAAFTGTLFEAAAEIEKKQGDISNTTLGIIITNGKFDKAQLCKIAAMAQNGYARAIRPVHTMADGDTVYALSVGDVPADINAAGTLAARVMTEAIKDAVLSAQPAYGLKCAACMNESSGKDL
ncbi:MAG: P1 family peptidase [Eubacteriaceae bacterium]|jgi:L-aminopeptidase/D-esterase-like protein